MHKTRNTRTKPRLPELPPADAWERSWQKHWSKVGLPGYELPTDDAGADERDFLNNVRTPEKERARLKRINDEFIRGFKGLFHVGPAVTVFGSARFKPCLLYTSDAADERSSVDLGGRRII